MTEREEVEEYLIGHLKKLSLTEDIRGQSLIFHDLGIRGLDAAEFISDVFERYKIRTNGFEFSRYFKGEYYSVTDLVDALLSRKNKTKEPLTLNHLIEVCLKQSWFDPPDRPNP